MITQTRERLGTDRPLLAQYGNYLLDLAHGDLGTSFHGAQSVREAVVTALPEHLGVGGRGDGRGGLLALGLGILAALAANGWFDRAVLVFVAIAQATPAFWLGVVLVFVFSLRLGWFPAIDMTGPRSFVLPVGHPRDHALPGAHPHRPPVVHRESQGEDFIRAARRAASPSGGCSSSTA